jgi:NitT/TauT family transport system permease protein/sulfonate transport system permease protein
MSEAAAGKRHGRLGGWFFRHSLPARLLADGAVVAVILVWWLASRSLPAFVLPSPWDTLAALGRYFVDPELMADMGATAARVVISVAAATLIGILLAIIPYYVPVARDIVRSRILPVLNAMPSLGWAILAVIWFGVSEVSVIFAQTAILVPFCFINVSQGIDEIDTELLEMARSYTRKRTLIFCRVIIPAVAPYVVAAARLAYGVSWKVALIAELFGSETGLGYVMYQAQVISDPAIVIATCVLIVILFVAGDALVLKPLYRLVSPQDRTN